jgi:hypothetical protein
MGLKALCRPGSWNQSEGEGSEMGGARLIDGHSFSIHTCRGNAMMGFIYPWICVQARIDRDPVDEVVYNSGDAVEARELLAPVYGWFPCPLPSCL